MRKQVIGLICCLLVSSTGVSQKSDTLETNFKRHTISIYYPNFYFFDRVPFHFSQVPENFGFSYSAFNRQKKRGLKVASEYYWSGIMPTYELGDIFQRAIIFVSVEFVKPLIVRRNFEITYFAEINHRLGDESYFVGYYNGWEFKLEHHLMIDFGASIGSEITYRLPFGLTTFANVKQSFYYYRYDRGSDYWIFEDGSPRNVLNFNIGLGWNFGEHKGTKTAHNPK